jgi:hypothetical protein
VNPQSETSHECSKKKNLTRPAKDPNETVSKMKSLFGWLVADGWCWFVLREEYCWLVAGGWFVLRKKYCWLVADKPSEQAVSRRLGLLGQMLRELML